MLTIAGSGPSTALVDHVDVATKKQSVPSDYVFCCFPHNYKGGPPLMLYRKGCGCGKCKACRAETYYCDSKHWDKYYSNFWRSRRPPQRTKPSTGLCAVFGVVERWAPKTIGLIGFDWILDGNPEWDHDAIAEKQAILSLVNIKDLRNGAFIRRVRPEGGVRLPCI